MQHTFSIPIPCCLLAQEYQQKRIDRADGFCKSTWKILYTHDARCFKRGFERSPCSLEILVHCVFATRIDFVLRVAEVGNNICKCNKKENLRIISSRCSCSLQLAFANVCAPAYSEAQNASDQIFNIPEQMSSFQCQQNLNSLQQD